MELRAAVGMAGHRVEIRTSDESGVLARDRNLFRDRISRIIARLAQTLARVGVPTPRSPGGADAQS